VNWTGQAIFVACDDFSSTLSHTNFVGQVGNLRPIGNRPVNNSGIQHQADYQSAAGYQPALHDIAAKPTPGIPNYWC